MGGLAVSGSGSDSQLDAGQHRVAGPVGLRMDASRREKILLLFAYLTAHQAGYLVGAYLGADFGEDS